MENTVGWAIDKRSDIDGYHAHGKGIIFDVANVEDYLPFEKGMYQKIQRIIIDVIKDKNNRLSFPIMWSINFPDGWREKNFSFKSDCELSQEELFEMKQLLSKMEEKIK